MVGTSKVCPIIVEVFLLFFFGMSIFRGSTAVTLGGSTVSGAHEGP